MRLLHNRAAASLFQTPQQLLIGQMYTEQCANGSVGAELTAQIEGVRILGDLLDHISGRRLIASDRRGVEIAVSRVELGPELLESVRCLTQITEWRSAHRQVLSQPRTEQTNERVYGLFVGRPLGGKVVLEPLGQPLPLHLKNEHPNE